MKSVSNHSYAKTVHTLKSIGKVLLPVALLLAAILCIGVAAGATSNTDSEAECEHAYKLYYNAEYHWYACEKCLAVLEDTAEAHVYADGAEATCTEGVACEKCGYVKESALGHDLVHTAEVPATCTETGTKEYWTCSRCEKLFSDANAKEEIEAPEVIEALGHLKAENAPACNPGKCQREGCDYVFEAAEHKYKDEDYVSGTDKLRCGAVCTVCNTQYRPEGHKFAPGSMCLTVGVCEVCEEKVEISHVLPDSFDPATFRCTDSVKCVRCGAELAGEKVHKPEAIEAHSATCTEAGNNSGNKCSAVVTINGVDYPCTYQEGGETIPANGHKWGKWVTVTAPTCQAGGEQTRTCSVCQATETKDVPADPDAHDWVLDEETTADSHSYYCSVKGCTEVKTEEHDWGDYYRSDKDGAESETAFYHARVCKVCQRMEVNKCVDDGKASCLTDGKCVYCGTVTTQALGHDFTTSETVITADAHSWACTRCGRVASENHVSDAKYDCLDGVCKVCGVAMAATKEHENPTPCIDSKCTVCGTELKATEEHKFALDDVVVDGPNGHSYVYVCTVCKIETYNVSEAHLLGDEPTDCTKGLYCYVCNYQLLEAQEAHVYDITNVIPAVPATCTTDGHSAYIQCKYCSVTTGLEIYPATGHTWVDVPAKEATADEPGYTAHRECSVCGAKDESYEVIPKLEGDVRDVNGDGVFTSDDAIALLYLTFGDPDIKYDFDGDGKVTSDDAILLLYMSF